MWIPGVDIQKSDEPKTTKKTNKEKKNNTTEKSKGMVVIPYVQGTAEALDRVFRKHNIATAMRPNTTLRKLLVHPKDKIEDIEKTDCVYKIHCKTCDHVYIGETGRNIVQ